MSGRGSAVVRELGVKGRTGQWRLSTCMLLRCESSRERRLRLRHRLPTVGGREDGVCVLGSTTRKHLFWVRHHHVAIHEYAGDALCDRGEDGCTCRRMV